MTDLQKKPLVLGIVGATASGKSALAMSAAQEFDGEIVCMDSMQVYRGMDIGTAKPTKAEQAAVPHHLLDVADPRASFSVAEYAALAPRSIEDILNRGKLPVLCGGTGLYLRAVSRPMSFGKTAADPALRTKYQELADREGSGSLHMMLQEKDPQSAVRLHKNDLRRVIRALEVLELTGIPLSSQTMPTDEEGPFDLRLYALSWERQTLYDRITKRAAQLMQAGLAEEVRELLRIGVLPDSQAMQGLGYKELAATMLRGEDMREAEELIARRTRNYAKRQLTWFQADKRIGWLNGADPIILQLSRIERDIREGG